ncbi:MAG: methylcrotonoyl-CoA carboxylase [candidate division Zixibacteria bacterium]|nr:methylcrotonoyl-CoA carboxylase [candidate division Zixibacteria bacterium]
MYRRIESKIDTKSEDFKANKEHHLRLRDEFLDRLEKIKQGGPPHMVERHKKRGKMTVRERLDALFDKNTPFIELSPLAAYDMYKNEAPSAGVVTGIGVVHGREVMVVANDATVKGGTYFPMTIKKHVRAQQVAEENHLPCVYLVDSGGIFLPHQAGTFPDQDHFGRIFFNQSVMSAKGIPQISVVMGSCTAGGAYVPALSDETVIVRKQGTIFIGGPPLVKAATGVEVTDEELGGADVHCRISGVADHYAQNDKHALETTRSIIASLDSPARFPLDRKEPVDPYYDPEELYGVVPENIKKPFDIREIIARVVDDSRFQEFKELYGVTLVTGFAHVMGYPVGILANNGVLFSESSVKGAHFIELCTERRIPLLFLQNISGFIVGKQYEHGGIASDGAKMVHAVANAKVPKLTVVVGGSYGAGNYAMCGRGYFPRLMWMWPNARISVMGGEQAADVLWTVKKRALAKKGEEVTGEMEKEFKKPTIERYEHEATPYYSGARLWDDGMIDPVETRKMIALGIAMSLNAPVPKTKYGVFRM